MNLYFQITGYSLGMFIWQSTEMPSPLLFLSDYSILKSPLSTLPPPSLLYALKGTFTSPFKCLSHCQFHIYVLI